MQYTILIIAPESAALPVARTLRLDLDAEVEVSTNRRAGLASLRRREFSLVLMDETLAATETEATDLLYQHAGGGLLVELNFALSGPGRILRQARGALARRAQDRAQARTAAASLLQSELNATLTGLLLESQLALREASPTLAPKLRNVVQLAGDLRERLRAA
jgi:hypothetical protein